MFQPECFPDLPGRSHDLAETVLYRINCFLLSLNRRRFRVAVAEVDHQDRWQRAGLGVAAVSGTAGHIAEVLDEVERFVWSFPEVEVLSSEREGS